MAERDIRRRRLTNNNTVCGETVDAISENGAGNLKLNQENCETPIQVRILSHRFFKKGERNETDSGGMVDVRTCKICQR